MVYMMKRNVTNEQRIEVGDLIRGYDFEPCKGRPDMYVVGIVREIGWVKGQYIAYTIECVYDSAAKEEPQYSRVGQTVYVPVQTTFDYDGRVTKI